MESKPIRQFIEEALSTYTGGDVSDDICGAVGCHGNVCLYIYVCMYDGACIFIKTFQVASFRRGAGCGVCDFTLSLSLSVLFNASSFFTSSQSTTLHSPYIYICQVCISLGGYESVFCQLLAYWVA
jgi:hypothetical protein